MSNRCAASLGFPIGSLHHNFKSRHWTMQGVKFVNNGLDRGNRNQEPIHVSRIPFKWLYYPFGEHVPDNETKTCGLQKSKASPFGRGGSELLKMARQGVPNMIMFWPVWMASKNCGTPYFWGSDCSTALLGYLHPWWARFPASVICRRTKYLGYRIPLHFNTPVRVNP